MTDLATLPALRDAMTVPDLSAHGGAIARLLGPDATVFLCANEGEARISIYPFGMCRVKDHQFIRAVTWPDALRAAHEWAASHWIVAREQRIRAMALAIMDLKDQCGRVTADMLERREFAAGEVRELHAAACVRAGEIAGGAPFVVERV